MLSKQQVREYVWKILEEKKVALFPNWGHIPNFKGVEETIKKILELEEYKKAKKIFVSPDTPQRPIIKYALKEKEVYMATPRLSKGFCKVKTYGTLKDILRSAEYTDIPYVDIAIIGSVAVDLKGNRIGKGGGYGDREIKMLREKNKDLIVITNVHDLQVFEDLSHLIEEYDERVNIIVTPTRVIRVNSIK